MKNKRSVFKLLIFNVLLAYSEQINFIDKNVHCDDSKNCITRKNISESWSNLKSKDDNLSVVSENINENQLNQGTLIRFSRQTENNEFSGSNPFLKNSVKVPQPPTELLTTKRPRPKGGNESRIRIGNRKKRPKRPPVNSGQTPKNRMRQNNAKRNKNKNNLKSGDGMKRVSQIKYEQYTTSIFPDMDQEDQISDFNGRELAKPGQFPHMGAIGFKNTVLNKTEYKCGAALISHIYVVTSAHCTEFNGLAPTYVRFGDLNLRASEETVDPQTRVIAGIINHPDYKDDFLYNDIALIQLEKPVIFTEFVRPIRLWWREVIPFSQAYAMGFGAVEFAGAQTFRLTELLLTLVANQICAEQLPDEPSLPDGIIDSQICAIDYSANSDTFQGDSGGPLQVSFYGRRGRLHSHLIGLTSFGVVGAVRLPGVYTRISTYVDWIEEVVWNAEYEEQ